MRPNPLIKLLKKDRAIVNGWLAIPNSSQRSDGSPRMGFTDCRHAAWSFDYQNVITMFQAICTTSTAPLARVPWLEEGSSCGCWTLGLMG